jgi:hypothetical protein
MDLDAKKWPDASTEDSSAFYKVNIVFWLKSDFMYLVKVQSRLLGLGLSSAFVMKLSTLSITSSSFTWCHFFQV